jgi:SAM-dependent methyltransferase
MSEINRTNDVDITEFYHHLSEYSPKKLLHIGGHFGEEGELYKELGIDFTYVEPVAEYAEEIRKRGYKCLEIAVGNLEGDFIVDEGGVSSFLKHPFEQVVKRIEYKKGVPLSEIEEGFDTIVMDTEGTALEVLQSGTLKDVQTIMCEIRKQPVFEGEASQQVVEDYLKTKGFEKVAEYLLKDVVFARVKHSSDQPKDFQKLAAAVPKYYENHPVYQSVWYGGRQIIKGTRDDMAPRMSKIRKEDIKDKVVVDIGCNLGAASFWAIENGAKKVFGFDVAAEGIEVAKLLAAEFNNNCVFDIGDFSKPQEKMGDVAFCFACHDDIGSPEVLRDNLKKYSIVYFETHLKNSFDNWDMPQVIKDSFNLEYLGETGEDDHLRDFYRMTPKD